MDCLSRAYEMLIKCAAHLNMQVASVLHTYFSVGVRHNRHTECKIIALFAIQLCS